MVLLFLLTPYQLDWIRGTMLTGSELCHFTRLWPSIPAAELGGGRKFGASFKGRLGTETKLHDLLRSPCAALRPTDAIRLGDIHDCARSFHDRHLIAIIL
jgi:hypothetical protein